MTKKSIIVTTSKWAAAVVILVVISNNDAIRRMVTRFCYTSPNTAQILSQCVLCDYFQFPTTTLACTGSTALTNNLTAQQALCIINNCFGQVQQIPSFVGRKKRDADDQGEEIHFAEIVKRSLNSDTDVYKVAKDVDVYLEPDVDEEQDDTFSL